MIVDCCIIILCNNCRLIQFNFYLVFGVSTVSRDDESCIGKCWNRCLQQHCSRSKYRNNLFFKCHYIFHLPSRYISLVQWTKDSTSSSLLTPRKGSSSSASWRDGIKKRRRLVPIKSGRNASVCGQRLFSI